MKKQIKAPLFPESVENGTVSAWHIKEGDPIRCDQLIADVETDKVVFEVLAPADGRLTAIVAPAGTVIEGAEVIAHYEETTDVDEPDTAPQSVSAVAGDNAPVLPQMSSAVRRLISEEKLDPGEIRGTGKKGRVTLADVSQHIKQQTVTADSTVDKDSGIEPVADAAGKDQDRIERRVALSRLRLRLAERMMQTCRETAMLTTFNEVDMSAVLQLRRNAGQDFLAKHGIKLGFMSFFIAAVAAACRKWPVLNASIDGEDAIYHGYLDVGVAVATDRGLIVPVIRDADQKSLSELEQAIADFSQRARDGKLALSELQGGTFTISNGGVFGSLLSTPLLNPPQVGILGLHRIGERPVAVNGQVVIRPIMNLALSYDHRLVDGREAVGFLKEIVTAIEQPGIFVLDI